MLLSDGEIRESLSTGELIIEPVNDNNIQHACVDLRLSETLRVQSRRPISGVSIDPEMLEVMPFLIANTTEEDLSGGRIWKLEPGAFVIGQTLERVGLPLHLAGRVEGRSRLARLGVGVHITAPKIDPGFHNRITLEIFNLGPWAIELKAGMRICTLIVERLGRAAQAGYGGVFQGA